MKQKLSFALTVIIAAILLIFVPTDASNVSADSQEVSYKIVESGSESVSIADGYFVKPAKYTVENGKNYVQMTLRDAQYVKSLSGPNGAVQVISDDGSKRVVKMQVGDMSQPVTLEMHVVVPKELAGMDYDHKHKARAIFDASGIKDSAPTATTTSTDGGKEVDNPKTSDNTPLALYSVLMLGSALLLFVIWKRRPSSN